MSMSDPLADMLTRIRNGQKAGMEVVDVPASKFKQAVLEVLAREGFIRSFKLVDHGQGKKDIAIELKYDQGVPVIETVKRISKPGRRVYTGMAAMPRFYNGLGLTIVSTPRGVMADHEAREQNVGGEILCQVF